MSPDPSSLQECAKAFGALFREHAGPTFHHARKVLHPFFVDSPARATRVLNYAGLSRELLATTVAATRDGSPYYNWKVIHYLAHGGYLPLLSQEQTDGCLTLRTVAEDTPLHLACDIPPHHHHRKPLKAPAPAFWTPELLRQENRKGRSVYQVACASKVLAHLDLSGLTQEDLWHEDHEGRSLMLQAVQTQQVYCLLPRMQISDLLRPLRYLDERHPRRFGIQPDLPEHDLPLNALEEALLSPELMSPEPKGKIISHGWAPHLAEVERAIQHVHGILDAAPVLPSWSIKPQISLERIEEWRQEVYLHAKAIEMEVPEEPATTSLDLI